MDLLPILFTVLFSEVKRTRAAIALTFKSIGQVELRKATESKQSFLSLQVEFSLVNPIDKPATFDLLDRLLTTL